jgi:UDP-2,3-diacylglucosamine hydrolase
MWIFDYIPDELGVKMYRDPIVRSFNGKQFFIGHGDGLGPGDHGYKFIKKVFSNKLCQWLFARLHPNLGIGLADFWSRRSRAKTGNTEDEYLGNDKEYLYQFCQAKLLEEHYDYFVFGHRHLPLDLQIENSKYINLGDWIKFDTYAVFDGKELSLKYYDDNQTS